MSETLLNSQKKILLLEFGSLCKSNFSSYWAFQLLNTSFMPKQLHTNLFKVFFRNLFCWYLFVTDVTLVICHYNDFVFFIIKYAMPNPADLDKFRNALCSTQTPKNRPRFIILEKVL